MILAGLEGAALGWLVTTYGARRGWPLYKCIAVALALWCAARAAAMLAAGMP